MARRSGFGAGLYQFAKAIDRAHKQHQRNELAAKRFELMQVREAEREKVRELREAERAIRSKAVIFEAEQQLAALERTKHLMERQAEIDGILEATLDVDDYFDMQSLRQIADHPEFTSAFSEEESEPPQLAVPDQPRLVLPPKPGLISRCFGGRERYERKCKLVQESFDNDFKVWESEVAAIPVRQEAMRIEWFERERIRKANLAQDLETYQRDCKQREEEVLSANQELESVIKGLQEGSAEAVELYLRIVLGRSVYPIGLKPDVWVCFEEETKTLKVNCRVVAPAELPSEKEFKYAKSTGEIAGKRKSDRELKEQYDTFLANIALRTIHEVFEADREAIVRNIDLTLCVSMADSGSAEREMQPLLNSRVSREMFLAAPLTADAPLQRLKAYDTVMSKNALLLLPICYEARRKTEERQLLEQERSLRDERIKTQQEEAKLRTEQLWSLYKEIDQILDVGIGWDFSVENFRKREDFFDEDSHRVDAEEVASSSAESARGPADGAGAVVGDRFQHMLEAQRHNAELDAIIEDASVGGEEGTRAFFLMIFSESKYATGFKPDIKVDFDGLSRELTLTITIPGPSAMPTVSEYVYMRSSDSIAEKKLAKSAQKERYENYVSAVMLRTAIEVCKSRRNDGVRSLSVRVFARNPVLGTNQQALIPIAEWTPGWTEIVGSISAYGNGTKAKNLLDATNAIVSRNLMSLAPLMSGKSIRRVRDAETSF